MTAMENLALALTILRGAKAAAETLREMMDDEPTEVRGVIVPQELDRDILALEIALARLELQLLDEELPW